MDRRVVAVVFTATGDKAFCTGGNTREYAEYYAGNPQEYKQYMRLFNDMIDSILRCDKPVINRVNGMRVAGGQEIGMACDFSDRGGHRRLRPGGPPARLRPRRWLHGLPSALRGLRGRHGEWRAVRSCGVRTGAAAGPAEPDRAGAGARRGVDRQPARDHGPHGRRLRESGLRRRSRPARSARRRVRSRPVPRPTCRGSTRRSNSSARGCSC